jgi:hypothetical protein
MDIYKINPDTHEYKRLYECIENFDEVDLLSQYAMLHKRADELIFISGGWNRGIDEIPEVYEKARLLAEQYAVEP